MKMIQKTAFAAVALAGAAIMASSPAAAGSAGVTVRLRVPAAVVVAPVVVAPYDAAYSPYDDQYYYDPIFISGSWYHGPYRWRMTNGEREFYVDGRWHRNEWRERAVPTSIVFRNGGSYRDGRYDGFGDSDRINARHHPADSNARGEGPDQKSNAGDGQQDRQDMNHDNNGTNPGN